MSAAECPECGGALVGREGCEKCPDPTCSFVGICGDGGFLGGGVRGR